MRAVQQCDEKHTGQECNCRDCIFKWHNLKHVDEKTVSSQQLEESIRDLPQEYSAPFGLDNPPNSSSAQAQLRQEYFAKKDECEQYHPPRIVYRGKLQEPRPERKVCEYADDTHIKRLNSMTINQETQTQSNMLTLRVNGDLEGKLTSVFAVTTDINGDIVSRVDMYGDAHAVNESELLPGNKVDQWMVTVGEGVFVWIKEGDPLPAVGMITEDLSYLVPPTAKRSSDNNKEVGQEMKKLRMPEETDKVKNEVKANQDSPPAGSDEQRSDVACMSSANFDCPLMESDEV